ncbi:TrkH family potassium uptake protein [Halobacillus yeomjeoni]|uniref:TrkH family potassium uptake protein n=1 Tax=Halobacillus yeomjeoni TaxID=311194 RepID=UPI001CD4D0DB|nr:TrkH family potassium uptake protein [Halobacillus yeomjeoni]MCA0985007.1 TrkH family potassium uptake protein [Halobacillus yeomjeoni]
MVFILCISLGAVLLKLPWATSEGILFIDALFTATSAMTVTGLGVVDTGTTFTLFGEVIILLLIQLGGLGIMTFAVLIFMMLGKRIRLKERILIQQSLNQTSIGGIVRLVRKLLLFSIIVEVAAALLLSIKWVPEMGFAEGVYASVFHSISAFNNAGFSIWSANLTGYVLDPFVNVVISLLFIIGGIGFTVLFDLWKSKTFLRLSLHTKIMLVGTFAVNVISVLMFFILEYNNPDTIGDFSVAGKLLASYFQGVTPRTAGFNTVDIGQMEDSSLFYMLTLMFIGGGSASTAGGIKLSTALIIFLAAIAFFQDKEHITLYHRSISVRMVMKALALTVGSVLIVFIGTFLLNLSEDAPFLMILFECISAFGTVGLTMGLTYELTETGKAILIFIMLIGKLGPLTFAFAFAKHKPTYIQYPKGDVLTG